MWDSNGYRRVNGDEKIAPFDSYTYYDPQASIDSNN